MSGTIRSGSNSNSAINRLCDHGAVPAPLWASFSGHNSLTSSTVASGRGLALIQGEQDGCWGSPAPQGSNLQCRKHGVQGTEAGVKSEGITEWTQQRAQEEAAQVQRALQEPHSTQRWERPVGADLGQTCTPDY